MIEREGELERIAHAELDAIGVAEHMARDAFAIDPGAVAAAQILDDVGAVFRNDASVLAGGPVVAQDQIVIGLAAQLKRKRLQRDPRSLAGGRKHQQSGGWERGAGVRLWGGHLMKGVCGLGARLTNRTPAEADA